jgi:hypothetical protein
MCTQVTDPRVPSSRLLLGHFDLHDVDQVVQVILLGLQRFLQGVDVLLHKLDFGLVMGDRFSPRLYTWYVVSVCRSACMIQH